MKEISIEEKAKRYDNLLVKLQEAKVDNKVCDERYCCVIDDIVPELKESEDKRIKKQIIYAIKELHVCDETKRECIAWLEKQGEQKSTTLELKAGCWYLCIEDYQPRADYTDFHQGEKYHCEKDGVMGKWCIKHPEKYFRECKKPADKVEPKFKAGDIIRLKGSAAEYTIKKVTDTTYYTNGWSCNIKRCEEDYELVEQKPVDKVETKFHEGDWVILTAGELSTTLQIVKVDTNKKLYWFNDSSYLPIVDEECLHFWSIQDAKDGDVLCTKNKCCPFIYDKGRYNNGLAYYYVGIDVSGNLNIKSPHNMLAHFGRLDNIRPATQEQRDLLFAKMKEAGYEWDAEKKELKKIEQKPAWKPSKEQMDLLREVQQALLGKDCHNRFVDFMYELKRLREE